MVNNTKYVMGESNMQKRATSRSKHLDFIILDLVCVVLSFFVAHHLRLGYAFDESYRIMIVILIFAHMALIFMSEGYSGILRRDFFMEFRKVVWHNICLLAVMLMGMFFLKNSTVFSRLLMAYFFCINTVVMYIVRCTRKHYLKKKKVNEKGSTHILVICNRARAEKNVDNLKSFSYAKVNLVGLAVMDESIVGEEISGIKVVADVNTVLEYVRVNVVDEVLMNAEAASTSLYDDLLMMGVVIHISVNSIIEQIPNPSVNTLNNFTVISSSINAMSFKQKVIKRTMDVLGGIVGTLIMIILFVIFAPIIYIQSPGPIFFKQTRVGKNGRHFKIYKFRSMYMDAEERKKELMEQNKMNGLMFKMDNDPRITPIGRFIRRTSIDEFPQFMNILMGDMSLVGTRPPTVDEVEKYDLHHKSRLAIKPGLTGMWQVSGRSDITDFEEVVRLDNEYIKNFSLSLDVKLLCKTIVVVLGRKGSV